LSREKEKPPHATVDNVQRILECCEMQRKEPLPPSFARHLLTLDKRTTLAGWLRELPRQARHSDRGRWLVEQLDACLSVDDTDEASLTYEATARRSFETEYWRTILYLSSGEFKTKNNADCVLDKATQARIGREGRDLEPLGNYLL